MSSQQLASELLTKAKSKMVMRLPFFAAIVLKLIFQEEPGVPTAATDSVRLLYNPDFISPLSNEETQGVLCHEVMHVALGHVFRRNGRDPILWNIACDYVVNDIIHNEVSSVALPAKHLYDKAYHGMSAEAVYEDVWKKCDKDKYLKELLQESMLGEVYDYEKDDTKQGNEKSLDEQQAQWKLNVAQAAQIAKAAGNLPGTIARLVKDLLNPKLPWRELLSRFITEKASDDYSWKLPNKRYLYSHMYLPTLDSPSMKNVGVIIDTSGSISDKDIRDFISEIQGILSVCSNTAIEVLYVDHVLHGHQTLTSESLEEIKAIGRGGTSFIPGFKYFTEKNIDISCVVYLTDGYCSDFPEDKYVNWETMWVINSKYEQFSPPFGEVIMLD